MEDKAEYIGCCYEIARTTSWLAEECTRTQGLTITLTLRRWLAETSARARKYAWIVAGNLAVLTRRYAIVFSFTYAA